MFLRLLFIASFLHHVSELRAQSLERVLPLADDPLQHSFYELEAAHGLAVAVSSGFNWESYTATVFASFSTDAGETWMQREFPIPKQKDEIRERKPRAVYIATDQSVWFGGDSGMLYRTTDHGLTWQNHSILDGRGIVCITFLNPMIGLAVGRQGLGLLTRDAGQSWEIMPKLSQYSLYSARMFTPDSFAVWDQLQRLLIYSHGVLIDSTDQLRAPHDSSRIIGAQELVWLSGEKVIALALNQIQVPDKNPPNTNETVVFKSLNAGRSFDIIYQDSLPLYEPLDVSFWGSRLGAAVGRGNNILLTQNGGESWSVDTLISTFSEFRNVAALDEEAVLLHGWTFAHGSIFKYTRQTNDVETGRDKVRLGTTLYPNPTHGPVSMQKWYGYEENVRIVDIFGRTVFTTKINREPGTSTIDCGHLPNGTYTVLINYEGSDLPVGRFVLMK